MRRRASRDIFKSSLISSSLPVSLVLCDKLPLGLPSFAPSDFFLVNASRVRDEIIDLSISADKLTAKMPYRILCSAPFNG
jgi:hypothetical protein